MAVAAMALLQVGGQTSLTTSFLAPTVKLSSPTDSLSTTAITTTHNPLPAATSVNSVTLIDSERPIRTHRSLLSFPPTSNSGPSSSTHKCSGGILSSLSKSLSWLGLPVCRLLGGCGVRPTVPWRSQSVGGVKELYESLHGGASTPSDYWTSGLEQPELWSEAEKERRQIPQYVLDYAPYVHLFSGEQFWPCDMAEHLHHITPFANYTPIEEMRDNMDLKNLDDLNHYGRGVYLQSNDNVEDRPDWLGGAKNIPKPQTPSTSGTHQQSVVSNSRHKQGYSGAPAVLIVIPKEHGIVDAFWFFFYSYNLGNKVVARFGNHIGDWEHTMIRFRNGEPETVFLSEHSWGEAYSIEAVEKIGERPVVYSATGSHAMYATPGLHPYVLPWGVLHDETDRGPLWDPSLNLHAFTYNLSTSELLSSTQTPKAPVNWFYYEGHWGDKAYPMSDPRQYTFAGQYHYVSGPIGPRYKRLGRDTVCQGRGPCKIKHWLGGTELPREWPGNDVSEEMALEDL